jgi:hypothetical protein
VYAGITHPGTLEALACREALETADDLALASIHVASDCLEVVQGLEEKNMGLFGSVLLEIRERAQQRVNTTFIHERRASNGEAHRLARFASSLPVGRYTWLVEPLEGLNIPVIFDFAE